jgi:hypothetical protein
MPDRPLIKDESTLMLRGILGQLGEAIQEFFSGTPNYVYIDHLSGKDLKGN